jgi:hypothetical protein
MPDLTERLKEAERIGIKRGLKLAATLARKEARRLCGDTDSIQYRVGYQISRTIKDAEKKL